jgi:hypothetical protein
VSKHTTCDDVDEDGVKRLVGVPGCRCRRRDVDVGAVLLGTNKARKNRNPNTHVNARKIWGKKKRLTNVVKSCMKITPDFVSNGEMDVKRGYIAVKIESKWCQK